MGNTFSQQRATRLQVDEPLGSGDAIESKHAERDSTPSQIDGGVHDPSDYVKVKVLTDDGVVEVTVPKGSPFAYTLDNKTGWEPAAVGKQVRTLFVVNDGADERPASSTEILKMLRFGMDPDNMRDG